MNKLVFKQLKNGALSLPFAGGARAHHDLYLQSDPYACRPIYTQACIIGPYGYSFPQTNPENEIETATVITKPVVIKGKEITSGSVIFKLTGYEAAIIVDARGKVFLMNYGEGRMPAYLTQNLDGMRETAADLMGQCHLVAYWNMGRKN